MSKQHRPVTLRADTPLYSLVSVWYGPNGALPPARYTAWVFGIAVTVAAFVPLLLVMPLDFVFRLIFAGLAAPMVGLAVTRRVFPHIDYYHPVRGIWQEFKAELSAPRHQPTTPATHTMRPKVIRRP